MTEEIHARRPRRKAAAQNKSADISPFVTNPEGSIYAVKNLSEEFIAVLFAWVSRSPLSFKEHLRKAIEDGFIDPEAYAGEEAAAKLTEKAKSFHEKWTVGYGHSSVAEHAVAHIGVEKVSRLASAELELSSTFHSITEYSQRYQRPLRFDWHNPFPAELPNDPDAMITGKHANQLHADFEQFMQECFDVFELLIDGIYQYLTKDLIFPSGIKEAAALEAKYKKIAFEDARYALPLAMHTQLGMTSNSRAWRDAIAQLKASSNPEVVEMAESIKTEITKVIPTLLKHAEASPYMRNSMKRVRPLLNQQPQVAYAPDVVELTKASLEQDAIIEIIALLIQQEGNLPYVEAHTRARHMSPDARTHIIQDLLFEIGQYDNPPEVFNAVHYDFSFLISEANWHQLLRHNRKANFTAPQPSMNHGITVPPNVKAAGFAQLLYDLADKAQRFAEVLERMGFVSEARYVTLNAARRPVNARFSLWEAYHLINLRTTEEAQWDIRATFDEVHRQIKQIHPLLISKAKRR